MAHPLPRGLTPSEVAFLCEMEQIHIIPRQKLESLDLIGGQTPALRPPYRASVPLWLALLLKKQRRADIVPPPWLNPASLSSILEDEVHLSGQSDFTPSVELPSNSNTTPPFQDDSTADAPADALPYHWLEMSQLLLASAADDIQDAETVRRHLRDLREVRLAKLRTKVGELGPGAGIEMNGIGAMEVGEGRTFLGGVVDGLRKLGKARETAEKERAEEEEEGQGTVDDDEDMIM